MAERKSVSMQDLADKLGISKVTVSKALNGKDGVGEELKENNKDAQRNYEQGERNWQLKAREQLCNGKLFYCNEPQHR